MKKTTFWLTAAFWILESSLFLPDSNSRQLYIEQYKDIAIQEMERTGIPASIILAQAILESGGGTSELARFANNHFGMKCTSDWKGENYNRIDDEQDDFGNPKHSCFKIFPDVMTGFIQHSELLLDPRRNYRQLLQYDATNYRAWAKGLQAGGYASDPFYASKLINIVEKYRLHQYDRPISQSTSITYPAAAIPNRQTKPEVREARPLPTEVLPEKKETRKRLEKQDNELFVYAQLNETMEDIARRTNKNLLDLMVYNSYYQGGNHPLPSGKLVYVRDPNYYKLNPNADATPEVVNVSEPVQSKNKNKEQIWAADFNEKVPLIPDLESIFDSIRAFEPVTATEKNASMQPEKAAASHNRAVAANAITYTIEQGDTLWSLSRRYNTTVEGIKKLNKLDSDLIRIGMQLRVL